MALPQVSLKLRLSPDGENSEWFTALTIPLAVFCMYSVRPRKWLSYLGYAVTGSVGVLSLDPNQTIPIRSCDMDALVVNAGDVYYFYATNTIHFVDPAAITTLTSQHSSQSRNSTRDELITLYRACPFTGLAGDYCHACHLIPHAKGDEYIRRFTEERSGGLLTIDEIDDIQNMLLLAPSLHEGLGKHTIAFLQTPNVVLKTNDVVENADPEAYRVTLHCFAQLDSVSLTHLNHGKSVNLLNEDTRPPEVIYSMTYGSTALKAWAPPLARALVEAHTRDTFYPGGTRTRGSDTAGKEREKAKREKGDQRKEARRERARNRNEGRPEGTSQDEDFDMFDMLLAFRYATQRSPEDLRKASEDECRKASVDKVHVWLSGH